MTPRLVDYLNQTILVSIPVLHPDAKCRSYTLLGVELQGLWLQDEALLRQLTSLEEEGPRVDPAAPAFVAFSHIAFVVLPAPYRKVAGFPDSMRAAAIAAAAAAAPADAHPAHRAAHKHAQKHTQAAVHRKKRGK